MAIIPEKTELATSEAIQTNTFDLTFEHKSDDIVLHKLSVVFVIQNDKAVSRDQKSDQIRLQLAIVHTNKNQELWMVRLANNVYSRKIHSI